MLEVKGLCSANGIADIDLQVKTNKTETAQPAARAKSGRRWNLAVRWKKIPSRWKKYALFGIGVPLVLVSIVMAYYWVVFSRMIDARISGEMTRTDPRVFARALELHRGQALSPRQLVDRLNDLGYAHRPRTEQPGEFTIGQGTMVIIPRDGDRKGQVLRIVFGGRPAKSTEPGRIDRIEVVGAKGSIERVKLDAPLITALITTGREKRRDVGRTV